jgi:hypothetical protein
MLDMKVFGNIRYVVDSQGKKAAVQLDLKTWQALLSYLEDLEDRALIKEKIHALENGPIASNALDWNEAGKAW